MSTPPAHPTRNDSIASQGSTDSVTAMDYINSQLRLESDARSALPYAFDTCTRPMGVLRQPIYACLTCTAHSTPPRFGETFATDGASLCYSCSISCHGDHELVEIFEKRNVVCECGTTCIPGRRCELRKEVDEKADETVRSYGQNYWGRFCECEVVYKPEKEVGTMYQCFLGDVCKEDWFHDTCIVGKGPPEYHRKVGEDGTKPEERAQGLGAGGEVKTGSAGGQAMDVDAETVDPPNSDAPNRTHVEVVSAVPTLPAESSVDRPMNDEGDEDEAPPGFPTEEFEHLICWRCVEKNPWLKRYAGTPGFLLGVERQSKTAGPNATDVIARISTEASESTSSSGPHKRKASEGPEDSGERSPKRARTPDAATSLNGGTSAVADTAAIAPKACKLPPPPESSAEISLFLKDDFRDHLCRCPSCFPLLSKHRCLLEEEDTYSPPKDEESASEADSLYDRGERALNSLDRVRAIEGVMAYNHLKDKVKAFLRPFAESGEAVGAEDIKKYFEKLRGDNVAAKDSEAAAEDGERSDNRKEGEGY